MSIGPLRSGQCIGATQTSGSVGEGLASMRTVLGGSLPSSVGRPTKKNTSLMPTP
ncbi:MAG: hypothetical protein HY289_13635 [Planctomycetes bacterium]|nr:hypothetical protein [Planctomycetota bacterium]